MKEMVIFTDLDGTLLDRNYSFKPAGAALEQVQRKEIPLVICSSKTRAEIERYRELLHNNHPFITENGGGIFIPKGYFKSSIGEAFQDLGPYWLIRLGAEYKELLKALQELKKKGYPVKGFSEMSIEEVSELTGLSSVEAALAKQREFDEPFIVEQEQLIDKITQEIERMGFKYTRGWINHIMGNSDKGRAVRILIDLYRKDRGEVLSVALGDSFNDLPMLESVDIAVVIKRFNNTYDPSLKKLKKAIFTEKPGPEGWNEIVLRLIKEFRD